MLGKAFLQLTEEERFKKFDAAIRRSTKNQLNAEKILALAKDLRLNHQYAIMVHPINEGRSDAFINAGVLHIYVPDSHIINEGE